MVHPVYFLLLDTLNKDLYRAFLLYGIRNG
jgi:hypothetical protein